MAQASSTHSALSVFKNRNFFLMFLAMLVSEFGTGITSIAASILVYNKTGSAASVGFMLMATALPGLFFGLIAGVFVDRFDRKKILVTTELISGFLILLIPFLLQYGIIWLYILVALKSTAYQFFSPAHNSILPDVATDDELAAANSYISASQFAAMGLGFAAAGFITSQLNADWAFYIDSATFFVSASLIALVTVPKAQQIVSETSIKSVFANLKEGALFLRESHVLLSMLVVTLLIGIDFGFFNSAMLPFAKTALGADEFAYSLMESIGLVGFVVGSLIMSVITDRLREGQWISISLIAMGILSILFSQATEVWHVIVLNVLILLFNVPSYVGRSLLIQRNTTREVRGRVSSVYFVVRSFSFTAGMALVGFADIFPIRSTLLVAAIVLTAIGLISLILPGLARPPKEWSHALELLRGISEAQGLDTGRSVSMTDIAHLQEVVPSLAAIPTSELQHVMADMTHTEARAGTVIVKQGEVNDNAYFILKGKAVAGHIVDGKEKVMNMLNAGDFFGEIAALTGKPRTANVLAQETIELLRVPAATLKKMAENPDIHRAVFAKMDERMSALHLVDSPLASRGMNPETLRSLRTRPIKRKEIWDLFMDGTLKEAFETDD